MRRVFSLYFWSRDEARPDNDPMLRPGHCVALCALALLVLGVVMVNSAGITLRRHEAITFESIVLSRSSLYMALAMFAMLLTSFLPVRRLLAAAIRIDPALGNPAALPTPQERGRFMSGKWIAGTVREYLRLWPVWLGVGVLLGLVALAYVPGIRLPKNGSYRWINLHLPGFDSLQPSEFAKWGLVLVIAWFGARSSKRMGSFWLGLVPGLVAAGLVAGVIVVEDLGTGALLAAASCVVLLGAGAKLWHLLVIVPVPVAGAVLAIVTNPYRMHRIEAFMNPYLEPDGKGFHMIQSMVAVANGQVFGRGLGNGLQKFDYLPEDTTDFLFAIICEELGVAGAMLVMSLIAGLVWSVWFVVRQEREQVFRLLGLGVMATIGIQALINLAVVTGLGPTKGIALPLLSSGGTGWVLICATLGLVIAIDRTSERGAGSVAEMTANAGTDSKADSSGGAEADAELQSVHGLATTELEVKPTRGERRKAASPSDGDASPSKPEQSMLFDPAL